MYRCEVCRGKSKAGETLKKFVVYREVSTPKPRKEIEKEIKVCSDCSYQLEHGVSLFDLLRSHRVQQNVGQAVQEEKEAPIVFKPIALTAMPFKKRSK